MEIANYGKTIQEAMQEVFRNPSYVALAGLLTVAAFLFSVWLPNLGLIGEVLRTSSATFGAKIKFIISLIGGITTNFSVLSAGYIVLVSGLFGANVAMIIYYVRQKRALVGKQELAVGAGGIASGILGIGCAACGSFLLSGTLSLAGASGALALLPLKGGEFRILSATLLSASLYLMSRKITEPLVCNLQYQK